MLYGQRYHSCRDLMGNLWSDPDRGRLIAYLTKRNLLLAVVLEVLPTPYETDYDPAALPVPLAFVPGVETLESRSV